MSIGIMALLFLMPISAIVMGEDNLVENGTFDTDMSDWNTQTSQNFTIESNNGYAEFNTTDTDWWFHNSRSDFVNASSSYNFTIQDHTPSETWGDAFLELSNTSQQVVPNPQFNSSLGTWAYTEVSGEAGTYIRGLYSTDTNVTPTESYSIQSIRRGGISTVPSSWAYINQTFNVNRSTIDISIWKKHYHDASGGSVRSSLQLFNDTGSNLNAVYNQSTTSSDDSWIQIEQSDWQFDGGNITTKLWSSQSVAEGIIEWYAKAVFWDNFTMTAREYSDNSTYVSEVINSTYYADWLEFRTDYGGNAEFGIDNAYNFTIETRVGNTSTPDGSWSVWQPVINRVQGFGGIGGYSQTADINSTNGQYLQYRVTNWDIDDNHEWHKFYRFGASSEEILPMAQEWGSMNQTITKPYTNYTTLKYKYKVDYLNNTYNGNITVQFGNYTVEEYNFTFFTTNWVNREYSLPTWFNASGSYDLNFTVQVRFNTTNGTSIVLFDDVEVLIEEQAPMITSFEVHSAIEIWFTGNFTDFSRGSDYQYLGVDGIDTVNITITGTVLEIDDYTYLGNGSFEFNYTWSDPPVIISQNQTENATLTVKDITELQDQEVDSLTYPSVADLLLSIFGIVLIVFILVIFGRHLATEWSTIKPKHEGIMPTTLTGKRR